MNGNFVDWAREGEMYVNTNCAEQGNYTSERGSSTMDRGERQKARSYVGTPHVLSTPVGLLAEQRITDKKYLFVRNIQDLAKGMTMEPLPLEGWETELVGLIKPFRALFTRAPTLQPGGSATLIR
jgi:hypothetical protein